MSNQNEKAMVTRHKALVEYAREIGMIDEDTPVLAHVSAEDVRGKHVIGVLPLHLAAEAASVTEIPLALTPEDRGKELSISRLRQIAGEPRRFVICNGPDWDRGRDAFRRIADDVGVNYVDPFDYAKP